MCSEIINNKLLYLRMIEQVLATALKNVRFINFQNGAAELMKIDKKELTEKQGDNLLIKIKAIGLNRAETLQRQGKYPLKPGEENLLGLEAAGEVYDPKTGEKLFNGMALINGGSYAEYVYAPRTHIMKIPNHLSFTEAAGIPQVWLTSFQLLRMAKVQPNDRVLIYAGASGVGTATIQLCHLFKALPFPLTSTPNKIAVCESLSAKGYSYKKQNWEQELLKQSDGKGFNVILDCVGASFSNNTIQLLSEDSRWVIYGLMGGAKVDLDLGKLLRLRTNLMFTTLKARSDEYKTDLIQEFTEKVLGGFEEKKLKPVIGKVLTHSWDNDASAFIQGHQIIENNQTEGKVIINYE